MLDGVKLTLLIGPMVPVPAPRAVLDALSSVQVNTYSGDTPSGFELSFAISKHSPLQTLFLLSGGGLIPLLRVVLVATFNGTPHTLIDGVATQHQLNPGERGNSTLVVQGKDLTSVMDYIDFSGIPYPGMPPALRVLLVVAKYAFLGVIPMVIPSFVQDLPIPVERIRVTRERPRLRAAARPRGLATCSTWSPARRPARASRTGARRSASACRSPHSTSTWMRTRTWSR